MPKKTNSFLLNCFRANQASARSFYFYLLTRTKIRKKSILRNFNLMTDWGSGCSKMIWGYPRQLIISISASCGIKSHENVHQDPIEGKELATTRIYCPAFRSIE